MSLRLQIINPIDYPGWDDLVKSTQHYCFFHSSSWAKVICESYKYSPLYFTLIDNDKLLALIPIMEIRSIISGKRGVSLPFSDRCEPIISEERYFTDSLNNIINFAKRSGWKYIQLRGGRRFLRDIDPSSYHYGHTLNLIQNEDVLFSSFRKGTKSSIKKAIREGVKVDICMSADSVKKFYQLNCLTRKKHGLPPQPYYFFEKIYEIIISENLGFVALASYDMKNIAGAIFLLFGEKGIYKYAASDRKYQHLGSNNLLLWEAIKWCCQKGLKSICFGRTEPENEGLRRFKRGWGTKEEIIRYYEYNIRGNAFVRDHSITKRSYNGVLSKMPLPFLKLVGSLLYKHMG